MIAERWQIKLDHFDCLPDGSGRGRYTIQIGNRIMTYCVRCFPWNGHEKVGRRADGLNRDMFSVLFYGSPSEERIQRELDLFENKDAPLGERDSVFGLRDVDRLRTNADVIGYIPANRSPTGFENVVAPLERGVQPDVDVLYQNSGYILRNAGFLGSGRNGTRSFDHYDADSPFSHPYFADLFGLYLIRQVSIDLVNATAKARNPDAAALSIAVARHIGVGNSSGQGMCVALQRWPQWVAAWMVVRELAIAFACCQPVSASNALAVVRDMLSRVAASYGVIRLQSEEHLVSPRAIASNLADIVGWLNAPDIGDILWGEIVDRARERYDLETVEQFHSVLIDAFPDFADSIVGYYRDGMRIPLDSEPETQVGAFRGEMRRTVGWALEMDRRLSHTRDQFWYHSVEGGEQRKGVRGLDPHEEFESFTDHVGAFQHLWCQLSKYDDERLIAEVVADNPDLHFAIARIQTLSKVPYGEIRENLVHQDFAPSDLIRFFLSTLGMEFTSPLNKRYVRGVFLQGMPLPQEILAGADPDWSFPTTIGAAS
jgi:hypothetical protein